MCCRTNHLLKGHCRPCHDSARCAALYWRGVGSAHEARAAPFVAGGAVCGLGGPRRAAPAAASGPPLHSR
jgi:hypothetical protein